MRISTLAVFLVIVIFQQNAVKSQEVDAKISDSANVDPQQYNLMLIGGGLQTCTSMSRHHCLNASFSTQEKSQLLYKVTPERLAALQASAPFLRQSSVYKQNFLSVFQHIYADVRDQVLTKHQLKAAFSRVNTAALNGANFYAQMPADLFQAMLDFVEFAQFDAQGARLQEKVDLAQNKNRHAHFIVNQFAAMARAKSAKSKSPLIAVVTASSRDPFESADFYQGMFEQAGANVIWLPLDPAFQQARAMQELGFAGCEKLAELHSNHGLFDRERIYPLLTALQRNWCQQPEKLQQVLREVQGVFFNGGDQSLTLAAMTKPDGSDSAELAIIRQRFEQGELVVGGTSAGTAVQAGGVFAQRPVPMLSNGQTGTAFSRGPFATAAPAQDCAMQQDCGNGVLGGDLTYQASGGTGLFNLGILDTHFSERDREGRLALLAAYTGTRFGFGIDEATALLVQQQADTANMAVIGQGGVFVVDSRDSIYKLQNNKRQVVALSHYLNHGDQMTYHNDDLLFSLRSNNVSLAGSLAEQGIWRQTISLACNNQSPQRWQLETLAFVTMPTEQSQFISDSDSGRCSYTNMAFGIEN